jgi:hypothetical protein
MIENKKDEVIVKLPGKLNGTQFIIQNLEVINFSVNFNKIVPILNDVFFNLRIAWFICWIILLNFRLMTAKIVKYLLVHPKEGLHFKHKRMMLKLAVNLNENSNLIVFSFAIVLTVISP